MSESSGDTRYELPDHPLRRNVDLAGLQLTPWQLLIGGVVGLLILASLPFLVLGTYYTGLLTTVMIFIALAGGFNLIAGYAGQLSLGHAVFFGSGAYVTTIVWKAGFTLWFSLLVSLVVGVVIAIVVGFITLRLSGLYFAFGTLATSEAIRLYISQLDAVNGSAGMNVTTAPSIPTSGFYLIALGVVVVMVLTTYVVKHSIFGLRLQAIRDDEVKAEAQGINVWLYKNIAFVLSAIFPTIAGGIYALHFRHIGPSVYGANININMQLMAVLGGLGTLTGPLLGGTLFYLLFQYTGVFFPDLQLLVTGVLLMTIVLYIPEGITGALFSEVWPERIEDSQTSADETSSDTEVDPDA